MSNNCFTNTLCCTPTKNFYPSWLQTLIAPRHAQITQGWGLPSNKRARDKDVLVAQNIAGAAQAMQGSLLASGTVPPSPPPTSPSCAVAEPKSLLSAVLQCAECKQCSYAVSGENDCGVSLDYCTPWPWTESLDLALDPRKLPHLHSSPKTPQLGQPAFSHRHCNCQLSSRWVSPISIVRASAPGWEGERTKPNGSFSAIPDNLSPAIRYNATQNNSFNNMQWPNVEKNGLLQAIHWDFFWSHLWHSEHLTSPSETQLGWREGGWRHQRGHWKKKNKESNADVGRVRFVKSPSHFANDWAEGLDHRSLLSDGRTWSNTRAAPSSSSSSSGSKSSNSSSSGRISSSSNSSSSRGLLSQSRPFQDNVRLAFKVREWKRCVPTNECQGVRPE